MNRTLFFLLLLVPFCSSAQIDLDSIRDVGGYYLDSMQYAKAISVFQQGHSIAKDQDDATAEGFFLIDIGFVYQEQNNLAEALQAYSDAEALGKRLNNKLILGHGKLNLGIIKKQIGDYTAALKLLTDAAIIFEAIDDNEHASSAYNSIGDLKNKQKEFTKALEYHRKALIHRTIFLRNADSSDHISAVTDLASSYNNIGELYKDIKQYPLARKYLQLALVLKEQLNDTLFQASTLAALADVYHSTGNSVLAAKLSYKAYYLRKKFNDPVGIANSANQIAGMSIDKKEYSLAEQYITEAINISQPNKINDALRDAYDLARRLYRLTNRYEEALHYDDLYIRQTELIFNIESRKAEKDTEIRYEVKKQEDKFIDLQKINKQRTLIQGSIISFLAIIILIGTYAYFDVRKANKREALARKDAQQAKEQIEVLWKELNHRIKNNLQTLSSMMSLQGSQIIDERSKKTLLDMENRVKAMGVMHRKLYLNNELTLIGIDVLITDLVTDLKVTFGMHNLELRSDIEQIELPADKAIPLGLIVNEVLTNAFKYAFINHPDPFLSIGLYKTQSGIRLSIKDNGPGFPEHGTKNNSFGFRLISLFSRQLNGTLDMDNDNGARVTLEIATS